LPDFFFVDLEREGFGREDFGTEKMAPAAALNNSNGV